MKNFFGAVLMGCGVLVAGLCGLCTLLVAGAAFVDTGLDAGAQMLNVVPAALVFGGVPVLIGVGLFYLGRRLIRSAARDRQQVDANPPDVFK